MKPRQAGSISERRASPNQNRSFDSDAPMFVKHHHQIAWFDVTMNDLLLMCRRQRRADLVNDEALNPEAIGPLRLMRRSTFHPQQTPSHRNNPLLWCRDGKQGNVWIS